MKKPGFKLIACLATAVILTGVSLYAIATEPGREKAAAQAQASMKTQETAMPEEIESHSITIEPTPEPGMKLVEMPWGAVEILCGEKHIAVLSTRSEAEELLQEYFATVSADTETERTLSATFDKPVYIVDAIGDMPLSTYEEVRELLLNDQTLIPVRMERERRELETDGELNIQLQEDPALAVGTRIVTQNGNIASLAVTTQLTYLGGELVSGTDPEIETLQEARTRIIRTGTYQAEKKNGEPGPNEGAEGRQSYGFSIVHPIGLSQPVIKSYFGTRRGSMHWGVDYEADAGTAILAPAEGLIVYCGERGEYGFVVEIDHGNGFVSRLTHCDGVKLEMNQRVFQGNPIATLQAEADGSKPVLHYELLIDGVPHNPVPYLQTSIG